MICTIWSEIPHIFKVSYVFYGYFLSFKFFVRNFKYQYFDESRQEAANKNLDINTVIPLDNPWIRTCWKKVQFNLLMSYHLLIRWFNESKSRFFFTNFLISSKRIYVGIAETNREKTLTNRNIKICESKIHESISWTDH